MVTEREIAKWKRKTEKTIGFKPYSLSKIMECDDALYYVIFGERSNGKTYSVLERALIMYVLHGEQSAYVRRYDVEFKGNRGKNLMSNFVSNGFVEFLTGGEWNNIRYWGGRWYLTKVDPETGETTSDSEPFMFAFALSTATSDKSVSYPKVTTIIFDEFLTRSFYMDDEFVLFMNLLSTIIRGRTGVKIFMLGNTVNKYCPYFSEMGLSHVQNMKPGDIDTYVYGDTKLKVVVELTKSNEAGKPSDCYFAFDNPRLRMITNGEWEINIYPRLKEHYRPKDVMFRFFIKFDGNSLKCDVVVNEEGIPFIFICPKRGDIKDVDNDLVYSPEYDIRPNWRRKITKPTLPVEHKITSLFRQDKVFYSSNEVGEVVRNYVLWCAHND